MKKKRVILALSCTGIFLIGTMCAFGQENRDELKDKKITIQAPKQSLRQIFRVLIEEYDVPIGFEESIQDREHDDYDFFTNLPGQIKTTAVNRGAATNVDAKIKVFVTIEEIFPIKEHWININLDNARLEDVLTLIVGQMANYKWEINDGVVNIFPVKGRDDRYERLLELNIRDFSLRKPLHIWKLKNGIFALPELKGFLDEKKLHYSTSRGDSLESMNRPLPDEMHFSNLTLRELLNKITKVKRGGWILKHRDFLNEKEGIDIDI